MRSPWPVSEGFYASIADNDDDAVTDEDIGDEELVASPITSPVRKRGRGRPTKKKAVTPTCSRPLTCPRHSSSDPHWRMACIDNQLSKIDGAPRISAIGPTAPRCRPAGPTPTRFGPPLSLRPTPTPHAIAPTPSPTTSSAFSAVCGSASACSPNSSPTRARPVASWKGPFRFGGRRVQVRSPQG